MKEMQLLSLPVTIIRMPWQDSFMPTRHFGTIALL